MSWRGAVQVTALAAALGALVPVAMAGPAPDTANAVAQADKLDGQGGCFLINELRGNHALGDRAVIFRVNGSDFFRMDFAQRCPELAFPHPTLILTPVGGNPSICRAIDLDVKVAEQGPGSFPVPCIPSALHKMTPAEVAAVPKRDLP